jgi:hypothetical protein
MCDRVYWANLVLDRNQLRAFVNTHVGPTVHPQMIAYMSMKSHVTSVV